MNFLNKNIRYKKEVYEKILQYHLMKWKIKVINKLKHKIKPTEEIENWKKKSNGGQNE